MQLGVVAPDDVAVDRPRDAAGFFFPFVQPRFRAEPFFAHVEFVVLVGRAAPQREEFAVDARVRVLRPVFVARRRAQREFFVGDAVQPLQLFLGEVERDLRRLRPLRVAGRRAEDAEGRGGAQHQDQRGDQHLDHRQTGLRAAADPRSDPGPHGHCLAYSRVRRPAPSPIFRSPRPSGFSIRRVTPM